MQKKKGQNIHAGHRQRMKQEFLARGLDGIPDHKALEMMLFFSIPQGDVNPLAHDLVNQFGSLFGVFGASYEQLVSIKGVGENTAILILLINALFTRFLQGQVDLEGVYQTCWQFKELLEPEFFGARNEMVYLVCLDAKMKLLAPPKRLSEGAANAAFISTRKVMEAALACNASAVVLAHNHISGLAFPSTDDIVTTKHLALSLRQVGILLYDHLIVADGEIVSMRDSGYFQE